MNTIGDGQIPQIKPVSDKYLMCSLIVIPRCYVDEYSHGHMITNDLK